MSTTTYCDPTTIMVNEQDVYQGDPCEKPDSRILDLRKGRNPQYLAYVTNRARFQRVARLNDEVERCAADGKNCTLTRNNNISQMLSRQPNYEQEKLKDGKLGAWVPKDPVEYDYRHPNTFPASTHQGEYVGDEQNHELYRHAQRDDRQCIQFDNRCGMLSEDGGVEANGALLNSLYSGKAWVKPGAKPSWASDNINERQKRGYVTDDQGDSFGGKNETLGYEDRQNR